MIVLPRGIYFTAARAMCPSLAVVRLVERRFVFGMRLV